MQITKSKDNIENSVLVSMLVIFQVWRHRPGPVMTTLQSSNWTYEWSTATGMIYLFGGELHDAA